MLKIIPLILILLLQLILFSCKQQSSENTLSTENVKNPLSAGGDEGMEILPEFSFETTEHDFGRIYDGVVVSYAFKFTNTGESDLLISKVKASCGCTTPEYPKKPVPPGEYGYVKVTFNSSGRTGFNNKIVTIIANTQPNTKVLTIKAMVLKTDD